MSSSNKRSRDDVLNDFAAEASSDRSVLTRYLRQYPEYAEDLVDLSYELSHLQKVGDEDLSTFDQQLLKKAWTRHKEAHPGESVDLLGQISAEKATQVVNTLDIPRQVFAAFRERRVLVNSIPPPIISQLANVIGSTVEELSNSIAQTPSLDSARSYKSDVTPEQAPQTTFEQLLIDAGVSEEKRDVLLREAE